MQIEVQIVGPSKLFRPTSDTRDRACHVAMPGCAAIAVSIADGFDA